MQGEGMPDVNSPEVKAQFEAMVGQRTLTPGGAQCTLRVVSTLETEM